MRKQLEDAELSAIVERQISFIELEGLVPEDNPVPTDATHPAKPRHEKNVSWNLQQPAKLPKPLVIKPSC